MNIKANVSDEKRKKGLILISIVSALCVLALALIVYNAIMMNFFYIILYIVGIVLGLSYILVSFNELYSTFIATDGKDLIMRCWDNCFFPHQTLSDIKFFGELLPAKTVRLRVPASQIKQIVIGTKMYIKRNVPDDSFLEALALYENTSYNSNQRMLEKIDIMYVKTIDNDSVFMSVNDFNAKTVMKLMRTLQKANSLIDIKLSGKEYRGFTSI